MKIFKYFVGSQKDYSYEITHNNFSFFTDGWRYDDSVGHKEQQCCREQCLLQKLQAFSFCEY